MKRYLSLILSLVLAFSLTLTLTACDSDEEDEDTSIISTSDTALSTSEITDTTTQEVAAAGSNSIYHCTTFTAKSNRRSISITNCEDNPGDVRILLNRGWTNDNVIAQCIISPGETVTFGPLSGYNQEYRINFYAISEIGEYTLATNTVHN